MDTFFDHEKLNVYQRAIQFVAWIEKSELAPKRKAILDQLDRASSSIALNIAEGNGKSSAKDRCRFFEIARGSALECAACLDVLLAQAALTPDRMSEGKRLLREVVSMLTSLIASVASRVAESEAPYVAGVNGRYEQEQE